MSEALFLTGRHTDQLRLLTDAHRRHPELQTQADNIFSQLLLAYECVALLSSGRTAAAQVLHRQVRLAALLPQYSWFKDYYEVLHWLTEVPFAKNTLDFTAL